MGNPNECIVCERNYPDGVSLIEGRCPDCRENFESHERSTTRKPRKSRSTGKE